MSLRVGIDSVEVVSVRDALEAHGDRYLQRVYTPGERAACARDDGSQDPERLAARFAAKEACVKALHAGASGIPWTDYELHRAPGGQPELELHGGALTLARAAGVEDLAVSFTHEGGLATAVVVAQVKNPA